MERIVCKEKHNDDQKLTCHSTDCKNTFGGVINTQVIIEAMLGGIYWAWMKLQKINSTFLRL